MYLQLIITLYGSNDSPVSSLPVFVPYFGDSVVKNLPANVGEPGSIPGLGRSPGGGNAYPLQYSCLENPTDRGAGWATVHGVAENPTQLSD